MENQALNQNTEEQFRAAVLNIGGNTSFSKEFHLGEGWIAMHLNFHIAWVRSTGATVAVDGPLNFIKNVYLKTDRGDILCNVPGKALYLWAQIKNGTAAPYDILAATPATS